MVGNLGKVKKEHGGLYAALGKMYDLIDNEKRHAVGIKIEVDQAKEDLLGQNTNADVDAFNPKSA